MAARVKPVAVLRQRVLHAHLCRCEKGWLEPGVALYPAWVAGRPDAASPFRYRRIYRRSPARRFPIHRSVTALHRALSFARMGRRSLRTHGGRPRRLSGARRRATPSRSLVRSRILQFHVRGYTRAGDRPISPLYPAWMAGKSKPLSRIRYLVFSQEPSRVRRFTRLAVASIRARRDAHALEIALARTR